MSVTEANKKLVRTLNRFIVRYRIKRLNSKPRLWNTHGLYRLSGLACSIKVEHHEAKNSFIWK